MKFFKWLLNKLKRRKRPDPELVYGAMPTVPQVGPMYGLAQMNLPPMSWAEPAKAKDDKK